MKEKLEKFEVPFTQVANVVFKDKRLSWRAKGLFGYIYSKPDNWDFSADRMSNDASDGADSTGEGIKELEATGYLTRKKRADGRVDYLISYKPNREIPKQGINLTGKIPPLSNTDLYTNKEEAKASFAVAKVDKFFRNDQKDGTVPMSLQDFVLMCRGSKDRHIRLIGDYAEDEDSGIVKENRGEWRQFGLRNMRIARKLVPYTDRKLQEAMSKLQKDLKENGGFITKWTLETLEKYL